MWGHSCSCDSAAASSDSSSPSCSSASFSYASSSSWPCASSSFAVLLCGLCTGIFLLGKGKPNFVKQLFLSRGKNKILSGTFLLSSGLGSLGSKNVPDKNRTAKIVIF